MSGFTDVRISISKQKKETWQGKEQTTPGGDTGDAQLSLIIIVIYSLLSFCFHLIG